MARLKITGQGKTNQIQTEHNAQITLCDYLDRHGLLYFSIPNAGKRGYKSSSGMKAEGLKAGVPDLFICEPRKVYHGLFIEMKRDAKSRVSEEQKRWIKDLNNKGYRAEVCRGIDAAITAVNEYLSVK